MCSGTLLHWANMGFLGSIANGSQLRQHLLPYRELVYMEDLEVDVWFSSHTNNVPYRPENRLSKYM